MKKKLVFPLVLIAVIIALIIYIFVSEKSQSPEPQKEELTSSSDWLLGDPSLLEYIALENPSGRVAFEKNKDGWWEIVEPRPANLDFGLLQLFVDELAKARKERVIEEKPEDLSLYKLEDPEYSITYRTAGTTVETTYYFGRFNPSNDRMYVMKEGSPRVFVIRRGLNMYLDRNFNSFRMKLLLLLPRESIKGFSIRILNPELKKDFPLARDTAFEKRMSADGRAIWRILEPIKEIAHQDSVMGVLIKLNDQPGYDVEDIEDNIADFGLDIPQAAMHLVSDEGDEVDILFGKYTEDKTGIYAWDTSRKEVFLIYLSMLEEIINQDFRIHRLILGHGFQEISRVSVEFPSSPENNYAMVPAGEIKGWLVEGEPEPIPVRRANWVIKPFFKTEFERYIYDDPPPLSREQLDSPSAVVSFFMKGEPAYRFAVIRAEEPNKTYVFDENKNNLVLYAMDIIKNLPPDKQYFFSERTSPEMEEEEEDQ